MRNRVVWWSPLASLEQCCLLPGGVGRVGVALDMQLYDRDASKVSHSRLVWGCQWGKLPGKTWGGDER